MVRKRLISLGEMSISWTQLKSLNKLTKGKPSRRMVKKLSKSKRKRKNKSLKLKTAKSLISRS